MDIGNYAFQITVDQAQAIGAIDQVSRKTAAMASTIGAPMGAAMQKLGTGVSGAAGHLSQLGESFSGLAGKIPGASSMLSPFTLALGGIGGLVGGLSSAMFTLAEFGKNARMVGMDAHNFSGLMILAGDHAGELAEVLTKMNRRLGEAQTSFEKGSEFRSLGLDPARMSSTSKALDEIFHRYNALSTATEKAVLLEKTFGRTGEEMGGIFRKVGTNVEALHQAMDEHGVGAAGIEAAERGAKAWNTVGMTLKQYFLAGSGEILAGLKGTIYDPIFGHGFHLFPENPALTKANEEAEAARRREEQPGVGEAV
jgi:hypothetical protein